MTLLYLIRHAETRQRPDQPVPEWTLTEEGLLMARALAGRRFWPELDRIVTSTEPKAWLTAAPAAELWRLPVEQRAAFDEVRRGGFIENYGARVAQFFTEPSRSPDGWERADEARARVVAGFETLLADYPGESLALVGHGLLWSLLRAYLLGQPQVDPAEWRAIAMPDVAVWQHAGAGWTLLQDFEGIRQQAGGGA